MIGPQQNTMGDISTGISSFFSSVVEGLSSGVKTIGSDILPNWVAGELNQQSEDQLNADTYNPKVASPRLDKSAYDNTQQYKPAAFDNWSLGTISGNAGNILMIGLVFVGALFVFKKF